MSFPESATVFGWGSDSAEIQAARDRGEIVVVLPRPWWADKSARADEKEEEAAA